MVILLIWIAVLIAVASIFCRKTYSKFSEHGVKHFTVVPFLGNMTRLIFRKDTLGDDLDRIYYTFSKERFVGRYEFIKPMLVVRDLELVKKITIKDVEHFIDHRNFVDGSNEPLILRNLFALRGNFMSVAKERIRYIFSGQEWKDMRSTLSPAFTSSKIKLMIPFMEEVGKQMIQALNNKIKESKTDFIVIDCKDLTTRYANDVIATCAFGLKVDSYTDERNQFYEMGKLASTFKLLNLIIFFALSTCPPLAKRLNVSFFPSKAKDFFVKLVTSTMQDREARKIIRPDMIHLFMQAKKGQLSYGDKKDNEDQKDTGFATVKESSIGKKTVDRVWSENDLVAQAILFFVAGFETVSNAMMFALHELAVNPDIQDRLVKEIKEYDKKNNGKLNLSSIQDMAYLDMVTSEVLRLWPPAMGLDRMCSKDYNMGKPNSKSAEDYIIKEGELISIPVWCFHRDPKYFPDPTKFDPERFSDENKHNIDSVAYMPFGLGPRNCIGSRFALCELKVLLYQILLHFEVSPSEKTHLPAKLSTESLNPRLLGGHWLRFQIRM